MKIIAITPDNKLDAVCCPIIEGMYDSGVDVIATDFGNSVKKIYSDDEVVSHAKNADYIFAFFGKVRGNRPPKYHLLDRIGRYDITAYIDGSEWTATGYPDGKHNIQAPWGSVNSQVYEAKLDHRRCKGSPWINEQMFNKCKWYFKRECYPEDYEAGMIPLLIGAQNRSLSENIVKEKDIDVFCSFGQLNNGLRYEIELLCKKLQSQGMNIVIKKGLQYEDYLDHIQRSYIAISSWGAGNSCMRMWENMANGACCFAQRTHTLFPDKPEDGIHYVEYSTIEEFEKKLLYYVNRKEECLSMGTSGASFVRNHHTGKARFQYMLERMKRS